MFEFHGRKYYKNKVEELEAILNELEYNEYADTKRRMQEDLASKSRNIQGQIEALQNRVRNLESQISQLEIKKTEIETPYLKKQKELDSAIKKIAKIKSVYDQIMYCSQYFMSEYIPASNFSKKLNAICEKDFLEELVPTVTIHLHNMDMKDLRKAYRENEKQIDKLVESYVVHYTTKANKTIYSLMVIALRAELQNILTELKFEKLDKGIEDIKKVTAKYLELACSGNQTIAGTLTKFIGQLEFLYINAVQIEYNYYVKREQARQEQAAIREQMRQEAEERKELERQRKKVEAEEAKYKAELEKLQVQLVEGDAENNEAIAERIAELNESLAAVNDRKEDIINLQNGKAGNVYIISNLGSFGEDVFKIGMTRRLEPQDRIDELGNASVPFKFDVHSFIFSDDAVSLETELHHRLNDRRVNKVNLRKEFFKISLDELEALTEEICPSAEFNRTMAAEEFRQSLSTDGVYDVSFRGGLDEDECEDED